MSHDPLGAGAQEPALNFAAFVLSLAHTAAVHFGDIPDPATGEMGQPYLAGAQQMIEILTLLEEKTRGNLSPEERQLLDQLLYELRLRWVAATEKGGTPEPEQKSRIIIP